MAGVRGAEAGARGKRLSDNQGSFVVVVGPDGVGKTSVARALCEKADPAAYFHFRPPVKTALLPKPPTFSQAPPTKGSPDGSRVLGWIRLLRNFFWFWIAFLVRIRPALKRGTLVVGDRWAYGYLTQPFPLKYYGPRWLAWFAIRALPQPDLVANLVAPASTIHQRKQELTEKEVASELQRWADLDLDQVRDFDATSDPDDVADRIADLIHHKDRSVHHKEFPPGWRHLSIPTSSRKAAQAGIAMYTASRYRGVLAQSVAWWVAGVLGPKALPGRTRLWVAPFEDDEWAHLEQDLRDSVGEFDSFAVYRPRQLPRKGLALLLLRRGRPLAFVKVRQAPVRLATEELALRSFAEYQSGAFETPSVLGSGSVETLHYLALSPMPARIHRTPDDPNLYAITEAITNHLTHLPKTKRTPDHWQPMHGDLTPWNLRRNGRRLFLIDWEDAGWGPRGADAVFYTATAKALGGHPSPLPFDAMEAARFWLDRMTPVETPSTDRFTGDIIGVLRVMEKAT